jgi:signal transduction histidine kinase
MSTVVASAPAVAHAGTTAGQVWYAAYPAVTAMPRTTPPTPPSVDSRSDSARNYETKLAEMAQRRHDVVMNTAGTSAVALAFTAVLGFGVSWVVAGRMLRPLQTLTAATRRISQDRLHERIALAGPRDEIKELADTFDEMVARLEASFDSQRRFVADASHELRTPLAIVRTGAEVLLAKRESTIAQWEAMGHRVLTASGRAERLVDGLLALARSDTAASSPGSGTTWRWRRPSRSARQMVTPSGPSWMSAPTCAPLSSTATRSCSNDWSATSWTTRSATTARAAG